jgi:hypothetical protein
VSRLRAGRHVGTVTDEQAWELSFGWGGQHRRDVIHSGGRCNGIGCWSKFATDEDREAAWYAVREQLIGSLSPGIRPAAFWYFEAESLCRHEPPCPRFPRDQLAWLRAHAQVAPRERRMK